MKIYDDIPDGIHRCRILSARKDVSKSGRDVIRIVLEAYGYDPKLTHYVTFIPERPDFASRQIAEIFSSSPNIDGEYELRRWSGHECACEICHENFNGRDTAKVARFVPASAQEWLPHFDDPRGRVVVCDAVCGEA